MVTKEADIELADDSLKDNEEGKPRNSIVSFAMDIEDEKETLSERNSVHFNKNVSDSIWTAKKKGRTVRAGSIYVKSRRFSRYGNLGNFFKPYLTKIKPKKNVLPIDSVGLMNNLSFWWINKYKVNEKKLKKLAMEKLVANNEDSDEKDIFTPLQIPMPTPKDRTAINQKRLLGKFKDEENSKAQERRSMYQVLWSFSKTRILITAVPHFFVLAIILVFPFLFKLTTDSIYEEFVRINNSKQYNQLTDSVFMASQLDFLNTLSTYEGPNKNRTESGVNFLKTYLQTMEYFSHHHMNKTWNPQLQNQPEMSLKYLKHVYETKEKRVLQDKNRHIYAGVMVCCFLLFTLLRNLINFLNLRTGLRFRSACIGAAYKKAMKSIVTYRIAPHQLMSLAMEESEILMSVSTKGLSIAINYAKLIIVTIIYCFVIFHLNLTLGAGFAYIVVFPVIGAMISRIASIYLKKSRKYRAQKLTLVEEFLINFKTVLMFQYQRKMIEKFTDVIKREFSSMRKKINWSARFIPELISILLFSIILLEEKDPKNPNENLVLFIYILTIQCLMTDHFEGIDSWVKVQPTLMKLKSTFQLQSTNISRSIPPATTVLSITNGVFNWYRWMDESWKHNKMDVLIKQKTSQLNINEFSVLKNQIVGVTGQSGSGKTMLMLAILGHTDWEGRVQQKGSFSFFPSMGYFHLDTLKENLLMNATYNRDCMDDALSLVGLDDALGDHHSLNDLIGNLELTPDQMDRLILAQAIYSENDLILLDNPMSKSDPNKYEENLEIFQNVIENLVLQKKSVIIATQNKDFLKCCHRIYFLEKGYITHEGSFKDLMKEPIVKDTIESSQQMFHYNNKTDFEGIASTGIHPEMTRNQEFSGYSQYSIFLIIILAICALTSIIAYFAMPTLTAIKSLASHSKLAMFIIASICAKLLALFTTNLFTSSAIQKAVISDKIKLKKLLRTSMNYLYGASLAEILQKFADNNFFDTLHLSNCIETFFGIVVTVALSSYLCPWLAIIYAFILIKMVFVYQFYKRTSKYLHEKMYKTNVLLYREMTNNIRGRVPLQSLPNFDKYLKHFYDLIDANSVSIFMYKAMVYHTQFLVQITMVLGFLALCFLILLLDPDDLLKTQTTFGYGVFLFLCFCDHANRLMGNLFEIRGDKIRDEKLHKWLVEVDQRKTNDQIIEDLNETINPKGYSVSIQDLVVKMGKRVNLSISKLDIKNSEKIRIHGQGSQYLVPLLSRILTPKTGIIFFGGTDIWAFSEEAMRKVIGFVPYHVQANSKTIRAILDPYNELDTDELIEILGNFKLLTNITNTKLTETISVLADWEKQVLCLIRLFITKPKILVIENPHPRAVEIIQSTIEDHFASATVIFIGSNDYDICTTTINLDDI